jgi:hypothetical protein
MKLYTFVVHYLQMCMKEYGCCPKFKRGNNSTYTFTKRGGCMYLVSTTPTKLLIEFLISSLVGVVLTRYMLPPLFVKV